MPDLKTPVFPRCDGTPLSGHMLVPGRRLRP
jgi:hypothetical protein